MKRRSRATTTTQGPPSSYGDAFAERFWLERPQAHVTRTLKRGVLAVTQLKSDLPTPAPSQSLGYDEAWLVGLMVCDIPNHQLWQDGRAVRTESFRAGDTALFDLRRDPINFTRSAHHSLHFYLPRTALEDLAERSDRPFDGELKYRFAVGHDDPVMRHLGLALLPALERGEALDGLFLDHMLHAVAAHVLGRYGESAPAPSRLVRGGLSRSNLNRALELMRAHLADDLSLTQLAQGCGLSVSHFTRAFRQSTGMPPYRWLQQQRVERAMSLLRNPHLPLAEIARQCGFADQSHFTRIFTKRVGVSPGHWRRMHA